MKGMDEEEGIDGGAPNYDGTSKRLEAAGEDPRAVPPRANRPRKRIGSTISLEKKPSTLPILKPKKNSHKEVDGRT